MTTVRHGSRVRIRDGAGNVSTVRMRDDGAPTTDSLHYDSPLGRALMDRRVGDEVEVILHPALPVRRVTIEAIEGP